MGKQTIVDTGPLTKKRMENVDGEFLDASLDFIDRAHQADEPFFVWFASSRMHFFTHVPKEWQGKSGLNFYADGNAPARSPGGRLAEEAGRSGNRGEQRSFSTPATTGRTPARGPMRA